MLGIALARRFPEARVVMADSNLLAVRYARRNAALNNAANAEVVGSVALEDIPAGDYDLIVANVPAKIGRRGDRGGVRARSAGAAGGGGAYWFVAVSGLNHLLKRIAGRGDIPLRQVRKRSGHTVYRTEA